MENSLEEFVYFNKKKILMTILFILIIGGVIGYYFYNNLFLKEEVKEEKKEVAKVSLEKSEEEDDDDEKIFCYFDIKGEVNKPGVYSIDCDKRIIDAITLAGGLTNKSDTSVLNLSKKMEDGMVIKIYSKTEVKNYVATLEKEEKAQAICQEEKIENDACNSSVNDTSTNSKLVNINTASLEELMSLSGIGEAKAKSIITYREKTPFTKIDDILNVEGIGESLYSSIKENITV